MCSKLRILLLAALICACSALPRYTDPFGDDDTTPLVLRERGGGGLQFPDFRSLLRKPAQSQEQPEPLFTPEDRAGDDQTLPFP